MMQHKTFDAAEFKAVDSAQGIAEMIVSVFHNVDSGDEVVLPGFFAESIATRRTIDGRPKAKGVWGHDWSVPIAKTLDAIELLPGDRRLPEKLKEFGGLWVKGQFNLETQRGREAFSDLSFGSIDEFSIGYGVKEDRYDTKTGVRYLIKGELYEWSPVMLGMNPDTALISTKGHGLSFDEHADRVAFVCQEFVQRCLSGAEIREKEGRPISEARRTRMTTVKDSLARGVEEIEALLLETEPKAKETEPAEVVEEAAPPTVVEPATTIDPKLVELHARFLELAAMHRAA